MSDETINKLKLIQNNIENLNYNVAKPNIICVSKTFPMQKLKPLIDFGHRHFGENKVQEAVEKWKEIKEKNKDLKIHMVGKLQTNKVKKAVRLFDFIHSLDNIKLADVLKKNESEFNKKISYFIQINTGNETQKSGIYAKDAKDFLKYCIEEAKLNIIVLMVKKRTIIERELAKFLLKKKEVGKLNQDILHPYTVEVVYQIKNQQLKNIIKGKK